MFITALFTIARTWKQPRCPLADEWVRKLWYIYTMEYYSIVKKNTFESVLMKWMKLEPICDYFYKTQDKKKKKPLVQSPFLYYSYKKISFQFKLFKYFFTTHSSRGLNESVLCLNLSYLTAVMNYTKKCIYNHSNKTRMQVNSITLLYLRREIHRKIKCFIPGCHEQITLRKWCF